MSFAGDLEHLPLVDVVQLLHATRKTGTLRLRSDHGESRLVFRDGFIVSCNHANNSLRIGRILLDLNLINRKQLDQALAAQRSNGPVGKPLIALLIEAGAVNADDAYASLETLMEMTIVEVLTWKQGTFSLDPDATAICDEYRYFPETLKQEILINTQSVLMDALRIYDEKTNDGSIHSLPFAAGQTGWESAGVDGAVEITLEDLGLADLDTLERKIPEVFQGIREHNRIEQHREMISGSLDSLPAGQQDDLLAFLMELSHRKSAPAEGAGPALAVIVFSTDGLLKHALMTICKHENLFVFTTDEEENLGHIIDQALSRELLPFLVMDAPDQEDGPAAADRTVAILERERGEHPELSVLQLAAPEEYEFSLRAIRSGARSVLPKPDRREPDFVQRYRMFLTTFQAYVCTSFLMPEQVLLHRFKDTVFRLDRLQEPPEVCLAVLQFFSTMFERCMTFVVGSTELVAERGIGIREDKSAGPCRPMMFRIPVKSGTLFHNVIESGRPFYGQTTDAVLRDHLYREIGAPYSSKILLTPIRRMGRIIALIYGDFGQKTGSLVNIELTDILTRHAGLVLDNAWYRKKLQPPA